MDNEMQRELRDVSYEFVFSAVALSAMTKIPILF